MSFVHLHTHSHYSLLDGLAKIDELVDKAKELGMPALALTDHGVMYGLVEFYQKATKAGIKPILGVETYVTRHKHTDKRPGIDVNPYHLVLLAKNNTGYKNLIKLITIAHVDGFYYKPRIDWELLQKYHEGIICTSACLQGEVAKNFVNGDDDKAEETAKRYLELFGEGNYYLEVQDHPNVAPQVEVNPKILALGKKLNIPVVATGDIHYLNQEDNFAQDVMVCIQTKKTVGDKDRMSMMGEDYSMQSPEQVKEAWKDHPEVVSNTVELADKCNVKLDLDTTILPNFEVPKGMDDNAYLWDLCEKGLVKRYGTADVSDEIRERLEYEMGIIKKTGYASYFLIVSDFITWSKENGIVVGPGRGSAAGSLVAYLTNITEIDPLQYDLIFERFLNPERISMPDIDTDFADTRRGEVLEYMSEKYGSDHVAQIITFGTMAARAAIRDVGRVLDLPYAYCDKVAKLIPMFTNLDEAIKTVPELQEVLLDPDGKRLIEVAKRLEGCVRHASTHACGVVVTRESMDNYVPQQISSQNDDDIVTQYEMHAVEDLGLLKIDLLGLKNLTIIENTLEIIKKARGVDINIGKIDLEDKKTFALLQRAETTGVFQLESSGMRRYLKMLVPTELEDIIAMVSLYRPGPMELIPDYIKSKHGQRKVTYLDDRMRGPLEKTYGIIVYQEQLMEIARTLAGFSYSDADVLRKAVGKKIASLLNEQEEKMVSGMVKNGIKPDVAKQIWDYILPFARYGFNRSHAACYALIAYQTAFLKAHYPLEFMASLLTADHGNTDRIAIEVDECRQMGIEVLPPDINESFSTFTVVYDSVEVKADKTSTKIRFGLEAVKNLGHNIIKAIIAERKENGHFESLEDFLSRVKTKDLNKKSLDALAKSGALDAFGERNNLIHNMDKLLLFVKSINQEADSKQTSLFGMMADESTLPKLYLEPSDPATDKQKLTWEKELLGLYVSAHPLSEFADHIKDSVVPVKHLLTSPDASRLGDIKVAGVITNVKKIITKKGEPMLFARIEDVTSGIEILVFPSLLKESHDIWEEDNVIMMNCKLSDKDGEAKLICNKARILEKDKIKDIIYDLNNFVDPRAKQSKYYKPKKQEEEFDKTVGSVYVLFPPQSDTGLNDKLKVIFDKHPGNYKLFLAVKNSNGYRKIMTNFMVDGSNELRQEVTALLGERTFTIQDN